MLFNGKVVRSIPRAGDGVVKTAQDLPIAEPGWLVVRCFEPASATIRYAHSSPFYFPVEGKLPVRATDATRWADYVKRLASALTAADYPDRGDYEKAQAIFREAEGVYRSLAKRE